MPPNVDIRRAKYPVVARLLQPLRTMKATTLLEQQHRHIETLFSRLIRVPPDALAMLVDLADHLVAHMAIEQNLFYPAVRKVKPALVGESYEQHAVAEYALKRLLVAGPHDKTFKAKAMVLRELIERHVAEEEHTLLLAVEAAMNEEQLEALGRQMEANYDAAVAAGYQTGLPKTYAQTSADVAMNRGPRPSA